MNDSNRAILNFKSDIGEIIRLSIPRANMNKTAANATTVMEAMIAAGTIRTSGGLPQAIHSAELVRTSRTNIVPQA